MSLTIEQFNNVDIYGAFSKHVNMGKERAKTNGGEHWSNCLLCGAGRDRFHIWPYRTDNTRHFWCRVCGRSGDVVAFIQEVEGLTFLETCEQLNVSLDGNYTPGSFRRAYDPRDDKPPSKAWQAAAKAFAEECKNILHSETGKNALAWLKARGLSDEMIRRAGLGYNPRDRYDEKSAWDVEDPKTKKVWLPRGITIPWLVDGQLWKVNIRRPDPDIERDLKRGIEHPPKYLPVKGGSKGIYGIDGLLLNPNKPVLIVEGEFCKRIAEQVASDICTPVATGSTGHGQGERWTLLIAQAPVVLIGFDADGGKGEKAAQYWTDHIPHSLLWLPWTKDGLDIKDVNDMYQGGLDIREWLNAGIELSRSFQEPTYAKAAPPPEQPSLQRTLLDEIEKVRILAKDIGREQIDWQLPGFPYGTVSPEEYRTRIQHCLESNDADTYLWALEDLAWQLAYCTQQKVQPGPLPTGTWTRLAYDLKARFPWPGHRKDAA